MHGGRELVYQEPETVSKDREDTANEGGGEAMHRIAQWSGHNMGQAKHAGHPGHPRQDDGPEREGQKGAHLPRGSKPRR